MYIQGSRLITSTSWIQSNSDKTIKHYHVESVNKKKKRKDTHPRDAESMLSTVHQTKAEQFTNSKQSRL